MSMSHKASNLALHNRVCSIPEGGILFPFDSGLHGIDSAGNIIYPEEGSVATLRPNEGRFSGAVAVEEGTTNHVPGNIQAWSDYISQASTYSITPVSTPYGSGVRLTGQSAGRVGKHTNGDVNLGTSYATASIYFKPNVASAILTFYWDARDDAGGWRYGTFSNKAINLSAYAPGQWYRLVCTASVAPNTFAGGTGFYVWAEGTFDVEIAAPQLEAKPFATSFVDGTRANGTLLYYDEPNSGDDYTIALWAKTHTNDPSTWQVLFDGRNARSQSMLAFSTSGVLTIYYRDSSGASKHRSTGFSMADRTGWHHYVLTFAGPRSSGTSRVFVDGQLVYTYEDSLQLPGTSGMYIGRGIPANELWNGLIDELLILPYAVTDEEIKAWYHSNSRIHNNADTYVTL